MTSHQVTSLGSVTIANGATASDAMDFTGWRRGAKALGITGPGTLTGTVKVQVSQDASSPTNWSDLESTGADVTIPADGHVVLQANSWNFLRLLSGSAEGGARVFIITGESGN